MNIRPPFLWLLITFTALTGARTAGAEDTAPPPNIIFILADDVSAKEYTLHGGRGIETPALDKMAAEGLFFRTAWAAPVCGPARCSLLTGRYNKHTGLGANEGETLRPKLLSYPQLGILMRDAGYKTALFGKLHHGGTPVEYGFDDYAYCGPWDGYSGQPQRSYAKHGMYAVHWYWNPGLVTPNGGIPTTEHDFGPEIECEHLLRFISRNKEHPFFVFWPTNLPHHEFDEAKNRWYRPAVPKLDEDGLATGETIPGSLKSNLEYLDGKLARIQRHLDRLGLAENTVIVYTADNGTAGYGKGQPENSVALRVPMVIAGGGTPALGPRDELVDFTDILPTFLELAREEAPEGIDGHSFAPLLRGQSFRGRTYIHGQGGLQRPPEMNGVTGEWVRDAHWLLDACDDLWNCGEERDERRFRKADLSDPGAQSALARLKAAKQTCQTF